MRKSKPLIVFSLLLLITVLLLAIYILFAQRVSKNPAGTVGNTAGNLNNGGFFCEYNGTVYFSCSADGGSLFSMDADEQNVKRLNQLKSRNILAGGDYLYYFQTGSTGSSFGQVDGQHSFNRCKLNGSSPRSMTRSTVVTAQLVDNRIYFLTAESDGPVFSRMQTDGSDKTVIDESQINPACAVNGMIYYNGTKTNHYLYSLNTATGVSNEIWRGNLWYPVVEGDYVYYMDVAENYRLCRYSFSRNEIEVLTTDRVDCFNVGNGYIYYQKNGENPELKCMFTDGSNVQTIAVGNYTAINMTSRYVYFQAFGDDSTTFHAPLGSPYVSIFSPVVSK